MWLLRVVWFVTGPAVAGAVDDGFGAFSDPVRLVAAVLVWSWWAAGLIAVLVPSPLGLTVIRIAAPGAAIAAALAALGQGADPPAIGLATAAAVLAATARVGDDFVDASSYGPERRLPLRVPGPLLVGPIPLAGAAVLAGTTIGPLLLAGQVWLVGAPVTVIGVAGAWFAARALHQLAQRWMVFVPGGVVVHDPMSVLDALLCRRDVVSAMTLAMADTEADDLTLGALGRAVQIDLATPVDYVPVAGRRSTIQLERTRSVLVAPTQPGLALELARDHRLPVGLSWPSRG